MKSYTLLAEIKTLQARHGVRALLPTAACLQGALVGSSPPSGSCSSWWRLLPAGLNSKRWVQLLKVQTKQKSIFNHSGVLLKAIVSSERNFYRRSCPALRRPRFLPPSNYAAQRTTPQTLLQNADIRHQTGEFLHDLSVLRDTQPHYEPTPVGRGIGLNTKRRVVRVVIGYLKPDFAVQGWKNTVKATRFL